MIDTYALALDNVDKVKRAWPSSTLRVTLVPGSPTLVRVRRGDFGRWHLMSVAEAIEFARQTRNAERRARRGVRKA